MAARRQLPRGFRRQRFAKPATPAAARGMSEARAALAGEGETPSFDQSMAERAQWRLSDEAPRRVQGCLSLEVRR